MKFKNAEELTKYCNDLVAEFGYIKINLSHGENNEGVWAVPIDKKSYNRYQNDKSNEEEIYCRLLNYPLGWNECVWGSLVIAKTKADFRPVAIIEDQNTELLIETNKNVFDIVNKELLNREANKNEQTTP